MKQIPTVEKYMTPMPHTINSELNVKAAKEMMNKFGIRHLPVQSGGKLVGVITDRDVKLAFAFKEGPELNIQDLMTADPFFVEPKAALDEVVAEMAERKLGCAIVQQDNGKVVGIFTATDGLRAFSEVLLSRFKK